MKDNFKDGIVYFISGFKLITQPSLRFYVVIPLLINITLFSIATWYSLGIFSACLNDLLAQIPAWLSFIKWLLWPVFIFTLGTFIFFVFNIIANIIAAPFNGILAEKTELYLTTQKLTTQKLTKKGLTKQHASNSISSTETGFNDFITIIPHSISREFHKLKYYFPRFILLALLSFIPGVNIVVFAFAAWMMAVQYLDYPLDNHKIIFKDMILIIKEKNLSALGFGTAVMLSLMIPLLNFIVIPAAVCGATLFWVDLLKDNTGEKYL